MIKEEELLEKYRKIYPKRDLPEDALVTRLAPSPTGFIHLGNLFTANINYYLAKNSNGVFYLRIEDTDTEREVEGAKEKLIEILNENEIVFDEGEKGETKEKEQTNEDETKGKYAPYLQSKRAEIYLDFVNFLIENGLAYKCYLTKEDIEKIREEQTEKNLTPGIYKGFSKYREEKTNQLTLENSNNNTDAKVKTNDEKGNFVVRLKSQGEPFHGGEENIKTIKVKDAIRGELEIPANFLDIVLIKNDGLPTYHLAHVVDDYLMGTTHVIRGEEWLSSLAIHIELFNLLKINPPIYAHTTVIMKNDNGKKRKLSKRKDPESSLLFYKEKGYLVKALREYLFTITNSNFEIWRKGNKEKDISEFPLSFKKMSKSGILFDLEKLNDISKNIFCEFSAEELYEKLLNWTKDFDEDSYKMIKEDKDYALKVLSIWQKKEKPRKDFYCFSQVVEEISFMFKEQFEKKFKENFSENQELDSEENRQENTEKNLDEKTKSDNKNIKSKLDKETIKEIIRTYKKSRNFNDDKEIWFEKVKEDLTKLGFAANKKDYKEDPQKYKGTINDYTSVIRLAITGKENSPDIFEIENVLGEDEVNKRLNEFYL